MVVVIAISLMVRVEFPFSNTADDPEEPCGSMMVKGSSGSEGLEYIIAASVNVVLS